MSEIEEDYCSNIPIPVDCLVAGGSEWKNGHSKSLAIVSATSAMISAISSLLLIRMIFASKQRLTTPYHRLLLGISIGDVFYSMTIASLQSMMPSDMNYAVWNANGNEASCSANGFIQTAFASITLFYSCSLNLYYLANIRFNKSDRYIRNKIEPFLHGVPIAVALILSITFLVNENYNNAGAWDCVSAPKYYPPHCIGIDDGEIREGFEIPCGRGRGEEFFLIGVLLLFFAPPLVIGVSLFMLYRGVSKQEKRSGRYGEHGLVVLESNRSSRRNSVGRSARGVDSNSRAVLNRALAFSLVYFLAWCWVIIGYIMVSAGVEAHQMPLAFVYMINIFNPLEGLGNFLIFLHPRVAKAKRRNNVSWCRAFGQVIWLGLKIDCKRRDAEDLEVVAAASRFATFGSHMSNRSSIRSSILLSLNIRQIGNINGRAKQDKTREEETQSQPVDDNAVATETGNQAGTVQLDPSIEDKEEEPEATPQGPDASRAHRNSIYWLSNILEEEKNELPVDGTGEDWVETPRV